MTAPLTHPENGDSEILTAEQLFESGIAGRTELIEGKLIRMAPTGYAHGIVEMKLSKKLGRFVEEHDLGQVMTGEVGIFIRRNPDTIRAADVIFISKKRFEQLKSVTYLDVAPEIVVEIISPTDLLQEVTGKIDDYFSIGIDRVWIVDPIHGHATVFRSPTKAIRFADDEELEDQSILPGFKLKLSELFSF